MATKSNVVILDNFNGLYTIAAKIDTATVAAPGDFASLEGSAGAKEVVLVDAAADDATFLGIFKDYSGTGDTDDVLISYKCIIECKTASANYDIGQALAYSAGANGTDWVVTDGGSNSLAWSLTTRATATDPIKVLIDVVGLSKLFAVNA